MTSPDANAAAPDRRRGGVRPRRGKERSLREQLHAAEQLAIHGRLAASAVHEISNLMTIVLFNAALLRETRPADEHAARYLDPLLQAGKRIAQLCSELRDKSRPERAEPRVLDLAVTLGATCQLLERIVLRRFELGLPAGAGITVLADPGQIDQMLVNLVFNARDATDEEGLIMVRCGFLADAAGERYFEVEDNGEGMPPEVRERLFTMFCTTKPRGRGTGLGLPAVRRLAQELGGRVECVAAPVRGTRVRIVLPAPPPASSDSPCPRPPSPP